MTDPYLLLPPMHPEASASPEPTPPAADDPDADGLDDVVEGRSPSVSPPERGESREPSTDDATDSDSEEPEDGEYDDRDWLIERARKADEYEAYLQSIRDGAEEKKVTRDWDAALAAKNAEFARREEAVYAKAEESLNPVAYVREEMRRLSAEADQWYANYQAGRDQALSRFEMARELPQLAARIVQHYKLPDESINEILEYAPEQMEREAQKMRARLLRERKQQKEIDQLKRADARRKAERTPLSTGGGRGAAGAERTDGMTPDELYAVIPWQRGRTRA